MTIKKPPALMKRYKVTVASTGANAGTLRLEWENHIATVPFTVK